MFLLDNHILETTEPQSEKLSRHQTLQLVAMRRCCCCSVKTGAVILGLRKFVVPLLIIVPLAGYWSGTDIDGLDVLRDNQKVLGKVFKGKVS